MQRKIFPPDCVLFHEISHRLRRNTDVSKSVISKRMAFSSLDSGRDKKKLKQKIDIQYTNDEEYHNMFGLTEKGLDLINESSYMAHRYGFIRLGHLGYEEKYWQVMKKAINYCANTAYLIEIFTTSTCLQSLQRDVRNLESVILSAQILIQVPGRN